MEKPLVKRHHFLYYWKHQDKEYVVTYDVLHECHAVFSREEWETKVVQFVRLNKFPYTGD